MNQGEGSGHQPSRRAALSPDLILKIAPILISALALLVSAMILYVSDIREQLSAHVLLADLTSPDLRDAVTKGEGVDFSINAKLLLANDGTEKLAITAISLFIVRHPRGRGRDDLCVNPWRESGLGVPLRSSSLPLMLPPNDLRIISLAGSVQQEFAPNDSRLLETCLQFELLDEHGVVHERVVPAASIDAHPDELGVRGGSMSYSGKSVRLF